jgi:predicted ATPase
MQLLEREPALDALGGWFAEARANHGRMVLVGGEAGVGKTTLGQRVLGPARAHRPDPAGRL